MDRVRVGLLALLEFFDEEPVLARFCVVHSARAGPAVLAARLQVLDRLARVLDDERAPVRCYPPALTAQAVVSGVLGVLDGLKGVKTVVWRERLLWAGSGSIA